jgi:hypothetical protein
MHTTFPGTCLAQRSQRKHPNHRPPRCLHEGGEAYNVWDLAEHFRSRTTPGITNLASFACLAHHCQLHSPLKRPNSPSTGPIRPRQHHYKHCWQLPDVQQRHSSKHCQVQCSLDRYLCCRFEKTLGCLPLESSWWCANKQLTPGLLNTSSW